MTTSNMAGSETVLMRAQLFDDRWSSYGKSLGIRQMSQLMEPAELASFDILREFKPDFLKELSPDISLVHWDAGSTLFEEGSYVDLAFWIVTGEVELFLRQHENSDRPIFKHTTSTTLETEFSGPTSRSASPDQPITYLATMDFDLPRGEHIRLQAGEFFGEIGALNGWPQSVTARTVTPCQLLQIRVPALRKIRRKSKQLRKRLDDLYRERVLLRHLESTPLLQDVGEAVVRDLAERVELRSFDPGETIASEGEEAEALYLVRSGFVKLSQVIGESDVVVSYLSKGGTLGEVELLVDGLSDWQSSATSVGYSELVKISKPDLLRVLANHPGVERGLWEVAVERIREAGYTRRHLDRSELVEFALAKGLVQGNSVLVIDLEVCTRCDDCVRGCASTHQGRPRFVREGEKHDGFLVARSCYHCEDPVCLIGCPTGAIARQNVGDVVAIDDDLCIGCGSCASNCPYDAIVMHDLGEVWPSDSLPERLRGEPREVASKCDLCFTSPAGPACVSSCPQGCAYRITSLEEFDALTRRARSL